MPEKRLDASLYLIVFRIHFQYGKNNYHEKVSCNVSFYCWSIKTKLFLKYSLRIFFNKIHGTFFFFFFFEEKVNAISFQTIEKILFKFSNLPLISSKTDDKHTPTFINKYTRNLSKKCR